MCNNSYSVSISENIKVCEVKQWQSTFVIISLAITVLRLLYWLVQASVTDDYSIFNLLLTLGFGVILSAYCRDYVNNYVVLSKI